MKGIYLKISKPVFYKAEILCILMILLIGMEMLSPNRARRISKRMRIILRSYAFYDGPVIMLFDLWFREILISSLPLANIIF